MSPRPTVFSAPTFSRPFGWSRKSLLSKDHGSHPRESNSRPTVYEGSASEAENTAPRETGSIAQPRAPEIELLGSPVAHSWPNGEPPASAADALTLAIKMALDEGDLDRAAALVEVAKRTRKPGTVTPIDSARGRDR
jgi:hypothetical protein